MIIRFLIIMLVIVIPTINYAQVETLLQDGIEKKIEIKYLSNDKGSINSKIIEKVASAKALPVHATVLVYSVKEHQKIIKRGNKLQLQLSIGNYVFTDDVVYKQFSINKYLTPSVVSYTYVWSGDNDKVIETDKVKNEKFKNGAFLLNKRIDIPDASSSYKLYFSDVSFGFLEQDFEKLDEFMATIDSYYDADAQLSMIEQEMNLMGIDSIEMLDKYRQQTINNTKVFNKIRFNRYTSKLSLNANDPIQFKSHFGRAEVRNRELKRELEKAINFMHITYHLKGMDWLKWGDIQKAKQFFEKSIAEKSNYAPPYYELAKMDFDNKLYEKAIDSCSMVINLLNTDTDTRYSCVKLSESVIYVYLDDINKFIEASDYSMALEKLNLCEDYSKNIPGVKVFEEFGEIHGKLFQAYYLDLANVAKQQIENMQLQQAQFNVDSLIEFRNMYKVYIQSPEKEHLLLKDLYIAWIEKGKYYLEENVSDSSLYAFVQASILCRKHEVVYCTDELTSLISTARINQYNALITHCDKLIQEQLADSALALLSNAETFREQNSLVKSEKVELLFLQAQQIKYGEFINIGYAKYSTSKSREALAYYGEARAIEESYKITIDTSLSGKIEFATRGYIILLCLQGETLVEALHINEARQKLSSAESLYTFYNMSSNEESTAAITNLKDILRTGICEEIQHSYNIQVLSSKKFIEKKEFIHASNALGKAKGIINKESKCELSDTATNRIANEISAMLYYQKQMVEINDELKDKEYSNTIDDYNGLTEFYYDSCENNFGIEHKNLYTYISTNSNKGLIDFGVRYYLQFEKGDTALVLLDILFKKKYIASWSKQSQVELGIQLAREDIETNSNQNPKIKVLVYTKDNKWYRYLRKAYLSEWKNL